MPRAFQPTRLATVALLGAALFATPPQAQTADHGGHAMAADAATATAAYVAAMMSGMMIPYSGNANVDFITGMIPHHQGGVDNARIALQYGTDPEMRKFTESVIAAQEAEIAWMKDWLARNAP